MAVTVRPRHAYVHVPFCRHRCGYCDFTLVAGRDDLIGRYFEALGRELARIDALPGGGPLEVDTLYLGGGTPSHLGPGGLLRLFETLSRRVRPAAAAEITVEANPLDVTDAFVGALASCGVTRVRPSPQISTIAWRASSMGVPGLVFDGNT